MIDIALIIMSGLIVYIIGYPILEWIRKAKEEMEEQNNDDAK